MFVPNYIRFCLFVCFLFSELINTILLYIILFTLEVIRIGNSLLRVSQAWPKQDILLIVGYVTQNPS